MTGVSLGAQQTEQMQYINHTEDTMAPEVAETSPSDDVVTTDDKESRRPFGSLSDISFNTEDSKINWKGVWAGVNALVTLVWLLDKLE